MSKFETGLSVIFIVLTVGILITLDKYSIFAQTNTLVNTANNTTSSRSENMNSSASTITMQNSTQKALSIYENTASNTSAKTNTINVTRLSGDEKVSVLTNFLPKHNGLSTDYIIEGSPVISINGVPLNFEYPVDKNDDITLSDMLMSMKATIKLKSQIDANDDKDVLQIRIFANPENITESVNGTKAYRNTPNNIEHIQIDDTFYYHILSEAILYPNNSGILKAYTP